MSYVHYTRAGSGNILPINAPQALFVAVNQNSILKPSTTNRCVGAPTVAQIGSCYVTADQGFPTGLTSTFNPLTDNVTYVPRGTRDSYVESYYLAIQRPAAQEHLARYRLCRQPWTQAAGLREHQPAEPSRRLRASQPSLHQVL